jgi:glycosyltransferase involved in cell wall biosynthesis
VVADGEVGYLAPRSADAFADWLQQLQENSVRAELGTKAGQRAREMTWDAVAERTEEVYENVSQETTTIRP